MTSATSTKVLVTGAKGYIGSRLVEYLKGYAVEGITEDIRAKEWLRPYFKGKDWVVHCAAKKYHATPEEFYAVNVLGTKNVVELCQEYGCKLIHFGSTEKNGDYGRTKEESVKLVDSRGVSAITLILPSISEKPKRHCYPITSLLEDIKNIIDEKSIHLR